MHRQECHAQGWMDGSMLAWLPEKGTRAPQPGKGTEQRCDRCKNTAMQRRGRAYPPFSNSRMSSVSMQHSCLKPNKITVPWKKNPKHPIVMQHRDKCMPGHCKHSTNCIILNEHDECACKSRTAQQHYPQIHF